MRRALSAMLVVLPLGLGGCLSDAFDDGQDVPGGLPARTLPWGLTDCRFGVVLVDVAAEVVQPHVPDGFRVLSVAEVGALAGGAPASPPNPTGGGNFGVEVFQCASGLGADGEEIPGLAYGSYFAAVEPPAGLARDVDVHFVKWDTLVPDEARRALLQSYGLPVRGGVGSVGLAAPAPLLTSYTGTLDFGGEETLGFEGSGVLPLEPVRFAEFMATASGLAVWTTTATIVSGGAGPQSVVVPSAGMANDILGSGLHRGAGFSGVASFSDGSIELPARP